MTERYDVAVVGGGLVGLASALALAQLGNGWRIAVIEKEAGVGLHQSSHNSGVLHSGLYYPPGSLKATLCVEGKRLLETFADGHGIPYERCGKVVVALDEAEFPALDELERRAAANGVPGVTRLGPDGLRDLEPHAAGRRALHIPGTAIIDFGRVATAYAAELTTAGATVFLGQRVDAIDRMAGGWLLRTAAAEVVAARVVTCAGLQADRCATMSGLRPEIRIVPFRGDYYTLAPSGRGLVRGLIYPVPEPGLPFLGVHFTRRIDGTVWAGPNAVLALAREGYRRSTIRPGELAASLAFPGLWRMARRHWRRAATEVWRDLFKAAYVRQLQRYVPAVSADQLVFGPSGVRAQAVRRDGTLVDDFVVAKGPNVLHVLNAPSPAATASLAIGRRVAEMARAHFDR